MIAVADTSTINYLVLIDQPHLLPIRYQRIIIPSAAHAELRHGAAPPAVSRWISNPPEWLEIYPWEAGVPLELEHLGPGEREAIALAGHLKSDVVLLDDLEARLIARKIGLTVTGVLGVLAQATKRNLVDLNAALFQLKDAGFYISQDLLNRVLQEAKG